MGLVGEDENAAVGVADFVQAAACTTGRPTSARTLPRFADTLAPLRHDLGSLASFDEDDR
jgi:hypothetical protein